MPPSGTGFTQYARKLIYEIKQEHNLIIMQKNKINHAISQIYGRPDSGSVLNIFSNSFLVGRLYIHPSMICVFFVEVFISVTKRDHKKPCFVVSCGCLSLVYYTVLFRWDMMIIYSQNTQVVISLSIPSGT